LLFYGAVTVLFCGAVTLLFSYWEEWGVKREERMDNGGGYGEKGRYGRKETEGAEAGVL
jgi:hypothetical protein